jgi:hypothetical protein
MPEVDAIPAISYQARSYNGVSFEIGGPLRRSSHDHYRAASPVPPPVGDLTVYRGRCCSPILAFARKGRRGIVLNHPNAFKD